MSNSKRAPAFRLQIKYDGRRYDFGTVWESERFPGMFDVTFQAGDVQHEKFPKMDASRALQLATKRDDGGKKVAYVSLVSTVRQTQHHAEPPTTSRDDFGGGDDLPF